MEKVRKNTGISKCRLLIFLPSVNDSTVKNGDKPFLIVELNRSRLGKKRWRIKKHDHLDFHHENTPI